MMCCFIAVLLILLGTATVNAVTPISQTTWAQYTSISGSGGCNGNPVLAASYVFNSQDTMFFQCQGNGHNGMWAIDGVSFNTAPTPLFVAQCSQMSFNQTQIGEAVTTLATAQYFVCDQTVYQGAISAWTAQPVGITPTSILNPTDPVYTIVATGQSDMYIRDPQNANAWISYPGGTYTATSIPSSNSMVLQFRTGNTLNDNSIYAYNPSTGIITIYANANDANPTYLNLYASGCTYMFGGASVLVFICGNTVVLQQTPKLGPSVAYITIPCFHVAYATFDYVQGISNGDLYGICDNPFRFVFRIPNLSTTSVSTTPYPNTVSVIYNPQLDSTNGCVTPISLTARYWSPTYVTFLVCSGRSYLYYMINSVAPAALAYPNGGSDVTLTAPSGSSVKYSTTCGTPGTSVANNACISMGMSSIKMACNSAGIVQYNVYYNTQCTSSFYVGTYTTNNRQCTTVSPADAFSAQCIMPNPTTTVYPTNYIQQRHAIDYSNTCGGTDPDIFTTQVTQGTCQSLSTVSFKFYCSDSGNMQYVLFTDTTCTAYYTQASLPSGGCVWDNMAQTPTAGIAVFQVSCELLPTSLSIVPAQANQVVGVWWSATLMQSAFTSSNVNILTVVQNTCFPGASQFSLQFYCAADGSIYYFVYWGGGAASCTAANFAYSNQGVTNTPWVGVDLCQWGICDSATGNHVMSFTAWCYAGWSTVTNAPTIPAAYAPSAGYVIQYLTYSSPSSCTTSPPANTVFSYAEENACISLTQSSYAANCDASGNVVVQSFQGTGCTQGGYWNSGTYTTGSCLNNNYYGHAATEAVQLSCFKPTLITPQGVPTSYFNIIYQVYPSYASCSSTLGLSSTANVPTTCVVNGALQACKGTASQATSISFNSGTQPQSYLATCGTSPPTTTPDSPLQTVIQSFASNTVGPHYRGITTITASSAASVQCLDTGVVSPGMSSNFFMQAFCEYAPPTCGPVPAGGAQCNGQGVCSSTSNLCQCNWNWQLPQSSPSSTYFCTTDYTACYVNQFDTLGCSNGQGTCVNAACQCGVESTSQQPYMGAQCQYSPTTYCVKTGTTNVIPVSAGFCYYSGSTFHKRCYPVYYTSSSATGLCSNSWCPGNRWNNTMCQCPSVPANPPHGPSTIVTKMVNTYAEPAVTPPDNDFEPMQLCIVGCRTSGGVECGPYTQVINDGQARPTICNVTSEFSGTAPNTYYNQYKSCTCGTGYIPDVTTQSSTCTNYCQYMATVYSGLTGNFLTGITTAQWNAAINSGQSLSSFANQFCQATVTTTTAAASTTPAPTTPITTTATPTTTTPPPTGSTTTSPPTATTTIPTTPTTATPTPTPTHTTSAVTTVTVTPTTTTAAPTTTVAPTTTNNNTIVAVQPDGGSSSSLSTGAIVGIAFGGIAGLVALGCLFRFRSGMTSGNPYLNLPRRGSAGAVELAATTTTTTGTIA